MACKKMAMIVATAVAVAFLCASSARAATTNVVDVAALVAAATSGVSETNGWTLSGLTNYNANCVKFDTKGDWLLSPDFGTPILRIEAKVRCSNTAPTRWLYVLDGETALTNFAACATSDKLESQTLVFPADSPVPCVKLKLDGSDNKGVWGIGELKIITADPVYAPMDLRVARKGGDWCSLAWENGENTVSNGVDTILVDHSDEGETVLLSTGFDNFSAKGNLVEMTDDLSKIAPDVVLGVTPEFSGVKIYAATNTVGVCQLGNRDLKGFLVYPGLSDYSDVTLRLVVMRYQHTDEAHSLKIRYEYGGVTNFIPSLQNQDVSLPDEYETRCIDLSGVPSNSKIIVGYYDGVGRNRRVLIDSLAFVRKGAETKTLVDSRWIPASPGAASFSTKDYGIELLPKSEYRFEVRAQNADGLVSPAATVDVVLDSLPGFRFILR